VRAERIATNADAHSSVVTTIAASTLGSSRRPRGVTAAVAVALALVIATGAPRHDCSSAQTMVARNRPASKRSTTPHHGS
jgi:hypothetical protein